MKTILKHHFRITLKELPAGKFQLIVNDCMMEDAGEVKFSCGYVETKAKLTVNINEEWRRLQAEKAEAAKGGERLNKVCIHSFIFLRKLVKPTSCIW